MALPIIESLFSQSFCVCTAEGIEQQLQPGSIGSLSQSELRQRILPIYQQCALVTFRRELPAMCKTWYQGLFAASERISEEQLSSGCRCMGQATDALRADEIQEVSGQTIQDYQDWLANPALRFVAVRSKSILGSLGQCLRKEGLVR